MVSVLSLLIPIALSAVLVFIASSIIHMATPWHKTDLMSLPDEHDVMKALRPFNLPPGNYGFPRPGSMADMKSPAFMEKVKAFQVLDVVAQAGRPFEVEVQVITLGDQLAWVSLPGEVFVELGLAIKQASPYAQTMIVELANGSVGYIPNRAAYAEGNYEVVSARCAEGSGEMLVEAALRLLR